MSRQNIEKVLSFLEKNPELALFVKDFQDNDTGFMFSDAPEICIIREALDNDSQSLLSFAYILRACQAILLGTQKLEDFMLEEELLIKIHQLETSYSSSPPPPILPFEKVEEGYCYYS